MLRRIIFRGNSFEKGNNIHCGGWQLKEVTLKIVFCFSGRNEMDFVGQEIRETYNGSSSLK